LPKIVNSLEALAHADGPGKRSTLDLEPILNLVEQPQRLQPVPVQLIDESDDGGIAHPANLHQLLRLRFHALGAVDNHQSAVDRREHPVGVFGEVLMTGSVQEVDFKVSIIELQHRRSDGNSAFPLD
jgi:hypothetical protein